MGWRPTEGRILVKPIEEEDTHPSGLIVLRDQKEKPNVGEVISGDSDFPSGWVVLYARYGGQDIMIGEEPHVVLDHNDILLVRTDD